MDVTYICSECDGTGLIYPDPEYRYSVSVPDEDCEWEVFYEIC